MTNRVLDGINSVIDAAKAQAGGYPAARNFATGKIGLDIL
jgi:hypothetical protein